MASLNRLGYTARQFRPLASPTGIKSSSLFNKALSEMSTTSHKASLSPGIPTKVDIAPHQLEITVKMDTPRLEVAPIKIDLQAPSSIPLSHPGSITLKAPESIPLSHPGTISLKAPESIPLSHPGTIALSHPGTIALSHPGSIQLQAPSSPGSQQLSSVTLPLTSLSKYDTTIPYSCIEDVFAEQGLEKKHRLWSWELKSSSRSDPEDVIQSSFILPAGYQNGPIGIRVGWYTTETKGTAGNVKFRLAVSIIKPKGMINSQSPVQFVESDNIHVNTPPEINTGYYYNNVITYTPGDTIASPGDLMMLILQRIKPLSADATSADMEYPNSIYIINMSVDYIT